MQMNARGLGEKKQENVTYSVKLVFALSFQNGQKYGTE